MGAATTVAIGSAVVSAGMSFGQAAKQNKLRKEAEAEAAKKIAAARSRLEKNFMESLSVPKGVFDDTMEALNSVGFAALTAAREGSQRGVGTVAQNVLNSQNDALRDVQSEREKQLFNLEAATAEEESRLRDARAGLDFQEAEGAQMAAADATEARNAAIQQGIGAVTEGIGAGLAANENFLLDDTTDAGTFYNSAQDITIDGNMKGGGVLRNSSLTPTPTNKDFSQIGMFPLPQAPSMPYGASIPQKFNAAGLGDFRNLSKRYAKYANMAGQINPNDYNPYLGLSPLGNIPTSGFSGYNTPTFTP